METKCNSDQWSNNDKYRCEYKICHACAKDYIWNPSTCSCENWKYLVSIMACSTVMCGQIIDVEPESNDKGKSSTKKQKLFLTIFNDITFKIQNILLAFLLITIALLIAVSIYGYLINYRAKQIRN